jgi:hypothetical protein
LMPEFSRPSMCYDTAFFILSLSLGVGRFMKNSSSTMSALSLEVLLVLVTILFNNDKASILNRELS